MLIQTDCVDRTADLCHECIGLRGVMMARPGGSQDLRRSHETFSQNMGHKAEFVQWSLSSLVCLRLSRRVDM
jgi:hypothetical protein